MAWASAATVSVRRVPTAASAIPNASTTCATEPDTLTEVSTANLRDGPEIPPHDRQSADRRSLASPSRSRRNHDGGRRTQPHNGAVDVVILCLLDFTCEDSHKCRELDEEAMPVPLYQAKAELFRTWAIRSGSACSSSDRTDRRRSANCLPSSASRRAASPSS
jgi:hypothetical protein